MSVYATNKDELCCPTCGEPNVGIGFVAVDNGEKTDATMPSSKHVPDGIGYKVALFGLCATCLGRFTLLFTTHGGVTYVESIRTDGLDRMAS